MNEVIPGILEKEWSAIERKLELLKSFAKTVHIDIIDGKFADNTTFLDPGPFKKYEKDFLLEVHMMVDNPLQYLKPWAEAGFQRFLGHIEKMPDPVEFVAQGQLLGAVGLAIDGPTSLDVLNDLNLSSRTTTCATGAAPPKVRAPKTSTTRPPACTSSASTRSCPSTRAANRPNGSSRRWTKRRRPPASASRS